MKSIENWFKLQEPKTQEVILQVITALHKEEIEQPNWPSDIIHASAIVNAQAGYLTNAAIDYEYKYEGEDNDKQLSKIKNEAAFTAAQAIRLLLAYKK